MCTNFWPIWLNKHKVLSIFWHAPKTYFHPSSVLHVERLMQLHVFKHMGITFRLHHYILCNFTPRRYHIFVTIEQNFSQFCLINTKLWALFWHASKTFWDRSYPTSVMASYNVVHCGRSQHLFTSFIQIVGPATVQAININNGKGFNNDHHILDQMITNINYVNNNNWYQWIKIACWIWLHSAMHRFYATKTKLG